MRNADCGIRNIEHYPNRRDLEQSANDLISDFVNRKIHDPVVVDSSPLTEFFSQNILALFGFMHSKSLTIWKEAVSFHLRHWKIR